MSLSETSEPAPLQFNTDVHLKEPAANMSSLTTEVTPKVITHNPHLEERLRLPDTAKNSGIINGSCGKSSMCFEPMNGFAFNVNNSEDENVTPTPLCNSCDCDVEKKDKQTLDQSSECDSSLSTSKTCSENNTCDGAEQSAKSTILCNESCVEKVIERLDNTSLIENSSVKEYEGKGDVIDGISYVVYESEKQMPDIMRLITKDLSEPYSIYTYRYFIHNWPKLCFLTMDKDVCVGAIVCKLDLHKKMVRRGYIAMLAVDSAYRRRKLGSTLVTKAIQAMIRDDCDEVVLETEITNQAALRLYENLGFVRDKRLFRYYLNGVDALRLKLWLR